MWTFTVINSGLIIETKGVDRRTIALRRWLSSIKPPVELIRCCDRQPRGHEELKRRKRRRRGCPQSQLNTRRRDCLWSKSWSCPLRSGPWIIKCRIEEFMYTPPPYRCPWNWHFYSFGRPYIRIMYTLFNYIIGTPRTDHYCEIFSLWDENRRNPWRREEGRLAKRSLGIVCE